MPGLAQVTCRNLRMCGWRAGKKKPNDCKKNENAGAGGVEIARNFYLEAEEIADKIAGRVEAVHEAAGEVEVVAGGSSIRLLIRVPGRLEKDQLSSRLLRLYIRPPDE